MRSWDHDWHLSSTNYNLYLAIVYLAHELHWDELEYLRPLGSSFYKTEKMESPWISLSKAREKLSAVLWKAWHYEVINPLFHIS